MVPKSKQVREIGVRIPVKKLSIVTFIALIATLGIKFYKKQTSIVDSSSTIMVEKTVAEARKAQPQQTGTSSKTPAKKMRNFKKKVVKVKNPYANWNEKYYNYQDDEGNVLLTDATIDGEHIIAHGDIIIGNTDDLESLQDKDAPLRLEKPSLWPDGVIPVVFDPDLENIDQIRDAISYYQEFTSIRFPQRTNQENYVRFKKGDQNCYSQLGMVGGEQHISLAPDCGRGEIIHELMHALGFIHEQNREDRDDHITILWENIQDGQVLQFKKILNTFLDVSRFKFDFESIMLYPPNAFTKYSGDYTITKKNGDSYVTNRKYLSTQDLEKIKFYYTSNIKLEASRY